ncbi:hypothetical protein LO763_15320 [Glycomyces sp. A-F 0318]|uniref:hypothetical protein n=1 Tax=Glycomyces amatae TaxID=2881355 RepID=UPI001E2C2BA9|nr:hypothetical protein [Glycomyces amatae]MCD0444986.1 hypothetical protein [Glycomyces amatae]
MHRTGETGPWALVAALNAWALDTDWVDWVEIGGSLGRGAGDELSDVDAGIGVRGLADRPGRVDEALDAARGLAPLAAALVQQWDGGAAHLLCAYRDGRQLSLVVLDEAVRTGLPPQAIAAVDKSGRLARALDRDRWDPDEAAVREWAFLAWIAIGDAARHRLRDHPWRALASLTEARDRLWRLHAHALGLVYPEFGAVTVENAEAEPPQGIERTHPRDLSPGELRRALAATGGLLAPYTSGDLRDLADTVEHRVALLSE